MNKSILLILILYALLVFFISLFKDYNYFSHKKNISWAASGTGINTACHYTNDNYKCGPEKTYLKYFKFDSIALLGYHSNFYVVELNGCINTIFKEECLQDEYCTWPTDECKHMKALEIMSGITSVGYK
tara:strand:+ start:519 stop:905 length:387 start_codon:yes stop_codon:yes gene_type:complete